jgi:hypothetical protein
MKRTGLVARILEMRNEWKMLVGKPERKRPLGRPRRRWKDNIGMNVKEVVWEDVNWKHLTQDRHQWRGLVNTVMDLLVP